MSSNNSYSLCNAVCSKEYKKEERWTYRRNVIIIFCITILCITLIVSVIMYVDKNENKWTINDSIIGIVSGCLGIVAFAIAYYYNNKPSKYAIFDINDDDIEALRSFKIELKSMYIELDKHNSELSSLNKIISIKKATKKGKGEQYTLGGIDEQRRELSPFVKRADIFENKLKDVSKEVKYVADVGKQYATEKYSDYKNLLNYFKNKSLDDLMQIKKEIEYSISLLKERIDISNNTFKELLLINDTYNDLLELESKVVNAVYDLADNFIKSNAYKLKNNTYKLKNNYIDINNIIITTNNIINNKNLSTTEKGKLVQIKNTIEVLNENIIDFMPDFFEHREFLTPDNIEHKENAFLCAQYYVQNKTQKDKIDKITNNSSIKYSLVSFSNKIRDDINLYQNILSDYFNKKNKEIQYNKEELRTIENIKNAKKDLTSSLSKILEQYNQIKELKNGLIDDYYNKYIKDSNAKLTELNVLENTEQTGSMLDAIVDNMFKFTKTRPERLEQKNELF